ncbi:MAG: hypothetical protein QOF35_2247 [Actinomycetota bacterium]|nr:hypothetical protein [Actinomycetota bacterium]
MGSHSHLPLTRHTARPLGRLRPRHIIEVSTLSKSPVTPGSEPSRDEDPTGVRALLSSLPAPDPMPAQLVERINASLAAEQLQRAARTPSTPVRPLVAFARRRPARVWVAMAAAAAAVALVTVAGSSIFHPGQITLDASSITARTSGGGAASKSEANGAAAAPSAADRAQGYAAPSAPSAPSALIQISQSGTRYTQAGFVSQVQPLHHASYPQASAKSPSLGPAATAAGLRECLGAIGAGAAQEVRADVAFYQGAPAVVIVATTNNVPVAYVVEPKCSRTDPAVLRRATPLS